MIVLRGVSKSFKNQKVLESISLELQEGQTHVLIGLSGSGKSTLLRMIMGLIPCDKGQIEINKEVLSETNRETLVKKMGYVIQDGGLFPHFTARENVTLMAKLMKWPREQISDRLKELTQLVGLKDSVLDQFPRELSGGQKQRVALLRALLPNPPLLLLDEPLGALDPIVRANLQEELKAIFNQLRKTVIIVTHDMSEAAYFGHTITLFNKGRIEQHGPMESFVKAPNSPFVREFIQAQRQIQIPELK